MLRMIHSCVSIHVVHTGYPVMFLLVIALERDACLFMQHRDIFSFFTQGAQ